MKATTRQDYFERMVSVLQHIEAHIGETITLEELADIACFSPYHFHRVFRSWVGESLAGYIRRLRMEQAASELRYGDKRVLHIALDAGFSSPEAFNRAFRKRFSTSPQEYRDTQSAYQNPVQGVNALRDHLFEQKEMSMIEVTIENMSPLQVASVRHVGSYSEAGIAWEKLCRWAAPKGLLRDDGSVMGICWDDPEICEEETIRFDAAVTVPAGIETDGEVVLQSVAGGEYAVAIHKGPLDTLPSTYRQIFVEWFPDSGRELRNSPCLEKYLTNPMEVKPEDMRLAVCIPLR